MAGSAILGVGLIYLLIAAMEVNCANILFSGLFGEGSHFLSQIPIAKSLTQKGHNITLLISEEFSQRAKNPAYSGFNFETFIISDHPGLIRRTTENSARVAFGKTTSVIQNMELLPASLFMTKEACRAVLSDTPLMDRLKDIDMIVFDLTWPCGIYMKSYLLRHMNASSIRVAVTSPMSPLQYLHEIAGSPFNPSYQPTFATGYSSSMSFTQRLGNVINWAIIHHLGKNRVFDCFSDLQKEFDLDSDLGMSSSFYYQNIDLYLMNIDFAVEFPFPLMPNVIAVGGLTSGPANNLSEDLEDFMNSSGEDGVIIFSLGTSVSTFASLRSDLMEMFFDAFSRLSQKVIMQLKDSQRFKIPSNVKALPWIPQNDLLGHSKTRVFMFQGGNNGFQEALYHGVPLVVIPFQTDQPDVAARIVSRGLGVKLDKKLLSTDLIQQKLSEVINNSSYSITAKRLSAIFRDRPLRPADRAAFWIEHVLKHGGKYMQSPSLELSFIQFYLIDVALFVTGIILVILYLIYRTCKLCKRCCSRSKPVKSKTD
nr:UDP-glucuronosyltransferase 1-6-like [Lytechinus pictus]